MNIKGPKGPGGPSGTPDVAKTDPAKADGASFKEVLESKAQPEALNVQNSVSQVISGLVDRVREGRMTSQEARQLLVAEIAKAMGPMPEEMRLRLETFLESQLQSDPGLSAHATVLFDNES